MQRAAFFLLCCLSLSACTAGADRSSSLQRPAAVAPSTCAVCNVVPASSLALPQLVASSDQNILVIGPTYVAAPENSPNSANPHGRIVTFTMQSTDSTIYPGTDPSLTTPGPYSRNVGVYVPAQYVPGSAAPFVVVQDGSSLQAQVSTVLDNLIAARQVPTMVAIFVDSGGGDGRGSERGLEYDTVSDAYARFLETEVLPLAATKANVVLTLDPNGRGAVGTSSGGAAAFTAAWFRPDLFTRVLTYSGTFVNQHPDATYPHSAWSYHEGLILDAPRQPLRVALEAGELDNNLDDTFGDGEHNWLSANERMSVALRAKGYPFQFLHARDAHHVDAGVIAQTLPGTLVWLWRDYQPPAAVAP